ncbi:sensor histidine kinase [Halalkalibacter sp. APA_J-10(15)]|uniref:sensor histidine kinase n=1 Tax=Halalkalibacter sp. APA_J-10(15) TaxID=2933805 RepID=UPI001FF1D606|nr:histidine kinase [Halalkalibacter sp. APA_J-10(15)]MCK0471807.1 sensor histidine kinase [Halalkalibacter sp. APA_J-10(15)]
MSPKKWLARLRGLYIYINSHLYYKLIIAVMILVTLPIVIVTTWATYYSTKNMVDEIFTTNTSGVQQASAIITEKFDAIDRVMQSLVMDGHFITQFKELSHEDSYRRHGATLTIESTLYSLHYTNRERIRSITLFADEAPQIISIGDQERSLVTWPSIEPTPHYQFMNHYRDQTFSFMRSINQFETRGSIGSIIIDVEWDMIQDNMDMLKTEEESSVFLMSEEGELLHQPYHEQSIDRQLFQDVQQVVTNSVDERSYVTLEDSYVFFAEIDNGHIYIVKVFPKSIVFASSMQIVRVGLLVALIAMVFAFVFTLIFSSTITKPIRKLASEMEQVEKENFQTTTRLSNRTDEVGRLERSYSYMINRIKQLIDQEYKSEIEKKDAQLMALQSKVNPHFLYNTLQLIGDRAFANKGEQVYEIIQALSRMFRYVVKQQKTLVTISEEVNYLQHYLAIQKRRFVGKLTVEVYVDEEAEYVELPVLTLQPIVENAFVHGFASSVDHWILDISVQVVFDEVEIMITDNGIGLDEEKLQQVKKRLQNSNQSPLEQQDSIGVSNVDSRIKLLFGQEYGVEIESSEDIGTSITIRIPK